MPRRFNFNFGDEEDRSNDYQPSVFSPRVKAPQLGNYTPDTARYKDEEEDPDPYGYDRTLKAYKDELGAEQPALAKYRHAMETMPQRQDYDLNKWGKLGAALSGFGAGYQDPAKGVAVATALREAPYKRALTDYDNQLKSLGNVAEFEQDDRKNRMAGIKLQLDTIKNRRDADKDAAIAASTVAHNNALSRKSDADIEREAGIAKVDAAYKAGLITVAQRNAETNRINAGTNQENALSTRMNANTNRGNLGVNQQNANTNTGRLNFQIGPEHERNLQNDMWNRYMDETEETGRNERDKTGSASYSTPSSQLDAQYMAASDIWNNLPGYHKYMTRDNKGNVTLKSNLTPAQLADPNYIKLKGELEGRANAILNRKRGGGGSRYEIQEQ